MTISLKDMASGVVALRDVDGFPYETLPPQGTVEVTFGTGNRVSVSADIDDFREAEAILIARVLQDYQKRVVAEKEELVEKFTKLEAFLGSPVFAKLEQDEQLRLNRQFSAMAAYINILTERIEAFTAKESQ